MRLQIAQLFLRLDYFLLFGVDLSLLVLELCGPGCVGGKVGLAVIDLLIERVGALKDVEIGLQTLQMVFCTGKVIFNCASIPCRAGGGGAWRIARRRTDLRCAFRGIGSAGA